MEESKRSGRKFDQNRVSGRYQVSREKVGQQKTRDRVGGRKQAIGERAIGRSER